VFECHLTLAQVQELQQRLDLLIVQSEDRVRYYPSGLFSFQRSG
jgi:CRISPR/Cas system-associated endoribonuclease Cas2